MKKNTGLNKKDTIFVVAQQFYGNRTGTEIHRDTVDFFLRGILSPELRVLAMPIRWTEKW